MVPVNLSQKWQRILAAREPRLVVLATLHHYGADPMATPHLAYQSGAVRLATEVASPDGLPFAPWLTAWPPIEERYAPQDRRLEIQETTLSVMGGAGLADVLLQAGGGHRATCRVDLWSPGLSLAESLPLLAGPVRGTPRLTSRGEGVEITVTDGDLGRVVEYPPGVLTFDEFPGAPDHVLGKATRQVILGAYPWQVACHQIDADGLLYYVHDGAATLHPAKAYNFGAELAQSFAVETQRTAASGTTVTVLRFRGKPTTPTGLVPTVSCSGGVATREGHPIETLLRVGGYKLTPRAAQALRLTDFWQDVLLNSTGDVREIVSRQLVPQTDLVFGFRHGAVDLMPLGGSPGAFRLGVGTGLQYRLREQDAPTTVDSVYNAFEVVCGRPGATVIIRRDSAHGSARIRAKLAASEATWGRRAVQWPAADLAIAADGTCPAGELLADVLALQHSAPWRFHGYRASWLEGMALGVGQGVLLTDPAESLADAAAVVARRTVLPTGVDLVFAMQADPARKLAATRSVFGG